MLHLTFAPEAGLLFKVFSDILKNLWKDPLSSPLIVTPNLVVKRWLKEMIVSEWGSIVEPKISNLENVLWEVLNPSPEIKLLDQKKLQHIIVTLLRREILTKECFISLLDYIGEENDPASDKRRIQIAGEIARFFLEYEYHRPSVWENNPKGKGRWKVYGVEKTWLNGKKMYFAERVKREFEDAVVKQEIWQKELYSMIFGKDGLLRKRTGNNLTDHNKTWYLTLPQLYIYKHDLYLQNGLEVFAEGEPLIVFLLNKISHFHRNMLLEMSEKREIYVLLVNVCAEFWEDVDTSRGGNSRRRWNSLFLKDTPIKKMSTEEFEQEELPILQSDAENKLLALWGKSGRENITLWCQAVEYDFEYIPPPIDNESSDSILKKFQRSILYRQSIKQSEFSTSDDSITILCAPEIGREVETLRENIFEVLYQDPSLKIEDIGVYVTNIEKYLPFIHKVFGAYEPEEDGYIPYMVIGNGLGESLFVRAIKDLLKLCEGEFTRGRIFSFLNNELVFKARNITSEEIEIWEKWALETGFRRGFDALHRKEMGDDDEIATDEHTFILGMARLLLGYFANLPVPLKLRSSILDKEKIHPFPYTDFNTSDRDLIEKYCFTIEELATSCRKIVKICKEKAPSEVVSEFISLCNRWLETTSTREESLKESFIESLLNIKLQEEIGECKSFSFNYLKELILACLPEEFPIQPIKLIGNLVFYPLQAGYVLPHKIIFVLGLDEDSFPGYNPETQLNLLYSKRIIGDPDKISDNRYSFLELLCAAKNRLFFSWVGLDILKDKIISPSSVLLELTGTTGIKLPNPTVKDSSVVPLSPYESISFSKPIPCWNPINARVAFMIQNKKDIVFLRDRIFYKKEKEKKDNYYEVNSEDIALFLKNPLEYHLKRTLLLKGEEHSEIISLIDEPLTSYPTYLLKREIFYSLLNEFSLKESPLEKANELVKNIYIKWCSLGKAPEGLFLKLEFQKLNEWTQKILQNIISIKTEYSEYKIIDKEKDEKYFTYNFIYNDREYKIKINFPFVLLSEYPLKEALLFRLSSFNSNEEWLWSKNFELWFYSLFLTIKGINRVENNIFSYGSGEILSTEWNIPFNFNFEIFHKWLDEIISAMIDNNECFFAPAIWFEESLKILKKQNKTTEFNKDFLYNIKDLAYEELGDNNKFPIYSSIIDFIKIIDISLPDDDVLFNIFKRLSPVLKGEFYVKD
ncbi:MAG: exodeoxyribonuclease V subunit gamma [Chitinispirillaceae bacterium]|nr:exodeoxyribonuclease V subunit gamma [Chitinispirillaceae bacterium]